MATVQQHVQSALATFGDADREIAATAASLDEAALVGLGQRLWWLSKRVTKALDPIKARLRDLAVQRANGAAGVQRFDGYAFDPTVGCTAVISPPTIIMRRDVDMGAIREFLGQAKFDEVFDTVTFYRPRKDITDRIANLEAAEASLVMAAVDVADMTPKISFKD